MRINCLPPLIASRQAAPFSWLTGNTNCRESLSSGKRRTSRSEARLEIRPNVEKLPLADIVAVNLDHYRLDADYKHGVHFTALPTAWVSGFDKTATLRIGSSAAWVAEATGATAGFLA